MMLALLAALALAQPAKTLSAQELLDSAPPSAWTAIPADDLMRLRLAGGRDVFIQLAPEFAPVHVANLRALARGEYWRGAGVYRVQDNFVAQWGIDETKRRLPRRAVARPPAEYERTAEGLAIAPLGQPDSYAPMVGFSAGWPLSVRDGKAAIAHCYAMVGVARDEAPDTGMGGELYAIIGQPARRLDRNLAVVGRVIEGIEHLASLPRGPIADRGRYGSRRKPIPIVAVTMLSDVPRARRPRFERFDTSSPAFAAYLAKKPADTNAFYVVPAGGLDLCSAAVPIRRRTAG
jgi:peptidylprolyl isomerase